MKTTPKLGPARFRTYIMRLYCTTRSIFSHIYYSTDTNILFSNFYSEINQHLINKFADNYNFSLLFSFFYWYFSLSQSAASLARLFFLLLLFLNKLSISKYIRDILVSFYCRFFTTFIIISLFAGPVFDEENSPRHFLLYLYVKFCFVGLLSFSFSFF